MDSHALVWPLELGIRTHTLRCGPLSWGYGLPRFGVHGPLSSGYGRSGAFMLRSKDCSCWGILYGFVLMLLAPLLMY